MYDSPGRLPASFAAPSPNLVDDPIDLSNPWKNEREVLKQRNGLDCTIDTYVGVGGMDIHSVSIPDFVSNLALGSALGYQTVLPIQLQTPSLPSPTLYSTLSETIPHRSSTTLNVVTTKQVIHKLNRRKAATFQRRLLSSLVI